MRARLWDLQTPPHDDAARLASALGVPALLGRLLWLRGVTGEEDAARFLAPRLEHLHDPDRMTDLPRAADRLLAAVGRRERIAVHGDYDVDGVAATVMLRRVLELLGGDVDHYIPDRLRDGYGLRPETVERLHADGVRVIVSVDCGIRSVEAADAASRLGVDLIITDHHEPDAALPAAYAVLNPKRPDCEYPDKHLAGAGVALKLTQGLCARTGRERWLPAFVKIAALGTLADVVPLVGENRVIAHLGLQELSGGRHGVGLRALLEASGLAGRQIDSYHVAFVLAPRINAAGRMSTPDLATRLLLASDETQTEEARLLAEQLNAENARRQDEEALILKAAQRLVESDPDVGAHNALVVAGDGWHRGVIGIVASKLVDAYAKPAIVISVDGEVAHGSCRSIRAFDMLAGLERCADLFERFGGHKQAAGFTLESGRVPELRRRLVRHADEALTPDDLRPRLGIDAVLPFSGIDPDVVASLARLAPFGLANPRPVFATTGAEVVAGPTRLKERHLQMTVRHEGRMFRAVAWRAAERASLFEEHRQALDLAYSLDLNRWRGETAVELTLVDARAAGPADPSSPA